MTSSALHSEVKITGARLRKGARTARRLPLYESRRRAAPASRSPHRRALAKKFRCEDEFAPLLDERSEPSQVPGGTVERITIVGQARKRTLESALSAESNERSADPSSREGVLTVTNTISELRAPPRPDRRRNAFGRLRCVFERLFQARRMAECPSQSLDAIGLDVVSVDGPSQLGEADHAGHADVAGADDADGRSIALVCAPLQYDGEERSHEQRRRASAKRA